MQAMCTNTHPTSFLKPASTTVLNSLPVKNDVEVSVLPTRQMLQGSYPGPFDGSSFFHSLLKYFEKTSSTPMSSLFTCTRSSESLGGIYPCFPHLILTQLQLFISSPVRGEIQCFISHEVK